MISLRRRHLVEVEDLASCPASIRDAMTDYLRVASRLLDLYGPALPVLRDLLARTGESRIVDLASGAGGPVLDLRAPLARSLGRPIRVTLTDRYPNRPAFERAVAASAGTVDFVARPVDARSVPPALAGVRTLFTALHHFRPADARAVLADAATARAPIAVFEVTERSATALLGMLLVPPTVLLFAPFIRPFRWSRLVWTYAVPVVPLASLWDGTVSCLRSYTPDELLEMAHAADGRTYAWSAGRLAGGVGRGVTYLTGTPLGA